MPFHRVRCPACGHVIEVQAGAGYAYLRTVIATHLIRCTDGVLNTEKLAIDELADRLAEAVRDRRGLGGDRVELTALLRSSIVAIASHPGLLTIEPNLQVEIIGALAHLASVAKIIEQRAGEVDAEDVRQIQSAATRLTCIAADSRPGKLDVPIATAATRILDYCAATTHWAN